MTTSVALASVKSSPGVTTAALALAAAWPSGPGGSPPPIVAELDPAGGDLAVRFERATPPDLVSLAAAARRGALAPSVVLEHCQTLPGGARVLFGPPSAERARFALELVGPAQLIGACDRTAGVGLVIDAGRLDPGSPAFGALEAARIALVVVRPVAEEVMHLAERVDGFKAAARRLGLLVSGRGDYPATEVAETLNLELVGVLPYDERGAALLAGKSGSARELARSPLMRAARTLADRLAATVGGFVPTPLPAATGMRSATEAAT